MVDDAGTALAIPIVVQTSSGPVAVRPLSAVDAPVLLKKLFLIIYTARGELLALKDANIDVGSAALRIFEKYPKEFYAVLETATDAKEGSLASGELSDVFEVMAAFLEANEKAIASFFAVRAAWAKVAAKVKRQSPSSSIFSSAPVGPTPTSEPLPSNSSSDTPDSPPSEKSEIASDV